MCFSTSRPYAILGPACADGYMFRRFRAVNGPLPRQNRRAKHSAGALSPESASCSFQKRYKSPSNISTNAHKRLVKRRQGRTATPFWGLSGMCENRCEIKKPPEEAPGSNSAPLSALDPLLCPCLSLCFHSAFKNRARRTFWGLECRRIKFSSIWGRSVNPRGCPKQLQDGPRAPPLLVPKTRQDTPKIP